MGKIKKGIVVGLVAILGSIGIYGGIKTPQIKEAYYIAVEADMLGAEAMKKEVTRKNLADYPDLARKVKDIETRTEEYINKYGSSTDFPTSIGILGAAITTDYENTGKYMYENF